MGEATSCFPACRCGTQHSALKMRICFWPLVLLLREIICRWIYDVNIHWEKKSTWQIRSVRAWSGLSFCFFWSYSDCVSSALCSGDLSSPMTCAIRWLKTLSNEAEMLLTATWQAGFWVPPLMLWLSSHKKAKWWWQNTVLCISTCTC